MGWTIEYDATRSDIIKRCTAGWSNEHGKVERVAHCCVGNNLWVVFESKPKDKQAYRFIVLYMLTGTKEGWGYKDVDESMGPYQLNCPLKYIELAEQKPMPPEIKNGYGYKWRQDVRDYWKGQQRIAADAKSLKAGNFFRACGRVYEFVRVYSKSAVLAKDSGRLWRVRFAQITEDAFPLARV